MSKVYLLRVIFVEYSSAKCQFKLLWKTACTWSLFLATPKEIQCVIFPAIYDLSVDTLASNCAMSMMTLITYR